jgi:hypothetical protein
MREGLMKPQRTLVGQARSLRRAEVVLFWRVARALRIPALVEWLSARLR